MNELPVAVIGGGPAGTAAAIELRRRGREVLLVERSRYDGARIGESVPPPASQLFRELGVDESVWTRDAIPCHGIWSAWGGDELFERSFVFNPYGHGWHVDRRRLDASLAGEAEARGAEVLRGTKLLACERVDGHWQLTLDCGTRGASFLIDASGRSSILGALFGAPRVPYDRLLGVAQRYAVEGEPQPITMVEAAENGWWYSAPLPGGALIAVYLTDADLHPPTGRDGASRWEKLLRSTRQTRERVAGLTPDGEPQTVMADTYRVTCAGDDGWINTGAAAAGVDPLSSDGICFALRSGCDAARAVTGGHLALRTYASWLDAYFARYLEERREFYAAEMRWRDHPFWSRRAISFSPSARARSPSRGRAPRV